MRREHWQDWGTALIGVWVVASPWLLHIAQVHNGDRLSVIDLVWSSWICGLFLILLGVSELPALARWKEWCTTIFGTWLFISPQVLGYPQANALAISCIIFGLATIALAGWAIGDSHEPLPPIR
jgi:hypothetical protein